jgi:hypothetical protein
MKTAYELAMERLAKSTPSIKLTDEQRRQLAEIDSFFAARIAERELTLRAEISKAEANDDMETVDKLSTQLANDRKTIQAEMEEKKNRIRQSQA